MNRKVLLAGLAVAVSAPRCDPEQAKKFTTYFSTWNDTLLVNTPVGVVTAGR